MNTYLVTYINSATKKEEFKFMITGTEKQLHEKLESQTVFLSENLILLVNEDMEVTAAKVSELDEFRGISNVIEEEE